MKKQFFAKHKGVAMAIAVGAAAMTAPMTTHAEESGTSTEPVVTTPTESTNPVNTTSTDPVTTTPTDPVNTTPTDPVTTTPTDPVTTTPTEDPVTITPTDPVNTTPTDPVTTTPTNPVTTTPTNPVNTTSTDPVTTTLTEPTDPVNTKDPADPDTPSDKPETLEEAQDNLEQAKKEKEEAKAEKEAAETEVLTTALEELEAQTAVNSANQEVQGITTTLTEEKNTAESNVTKAEQTVKNAETSEESNQTMADLTERQDKKDELTEIIAGTLTGDQSQSDESKKQEAEKQANDLIVAQEAVKTAEEKAAKAETALRDATTQEDSGKVKAEIAQAEMAESKKKLADCQEELNALEKKVAEAQDTLQKEIDNAKTEEIPNDTKQALTALLNQYANAQTALNTALATQTDVTAAQQTLCDAKTELENLSKAQNAYATALKNRNDKQTALDNIQNASSEVSAAQTALQELVSNRKNIKGICDKLQNLTPDEAKNPENLDALKAKLDGAAGKFTDTQDNYSKAVTAIGTYLKEVHDLNVPTTELLDATWLTGNSDVDAAAAAAEKTKLLNALSEALKDNLSASAKTELDTAETALSKAKAELMTAVRTIINTTPEQKAENELPSADTVTKDLSDAATDLTTKVSVITTQVGAPEETLTPKLTSAAELLTSASNALEAFATAVNIEDDGTLNAIEQSVIDNAETAIDNALNALVIKSGEQSQGIADAYVTAKQDAVTNAQEALENRINNSTPSSELQTAISNAYNGLVSAQSDLTTQKTDLQKKIADANKEYIAKATEYREAFAQLTWLQQDLADANANVNNAKNHYEELLTKYDNTQGVQDTSTSDKLKTALSDYATAQQNWVSARQKIETTRQSIKDAKENLSAKKTERTKAIAKKTLAETIFAGRDASSVEEKIKEMGFQLSNFENEILNYQTARNAVTLAETALTASENEHYKAVAALKDATTKYELAAANLTIAQGDYDALKPKPSVPSTPSTPSAPVATHVQSSHVNTPPSYEAAYEVVSADAGHEDDSAYTYAGFLKECEKSILTLKPMNRTSPNLQLSVNSSVLTIKTKTWMSFDRKVIEALSKRPDLALDLSFFYKGKWYRAIIPAGYDLTSLLNEEGYCGFLYLYSLFGVVWQTPAV